MIEGGERERGQPINREKIDQRLSVSAGDGCEARVIPKIKPLERYHAIYRSLLFSEKRAGFQGSCDMRSGIWNRICNTLKTTTDCRKQAFLREGRFLLSPSPRPDGELVVAVGRWLVRLKGKWEMTNRRLIAFLHPRRQNTPKRRRKEGSEEAFIVHPLSPSPLLISYFCILPSMAAVMALIG